MGDFFSAESRKQTGAAGPAGPPGPAGVPYLQATAASAITSGQVAKAVSGGSITLCTGGASGDGDLIRGVVHPSAAMGATANFYPDGSAAPIAGLPVGPVFRLSTGGLGDWASVGSGDYTQQIGISDGTAVQIRVSSEIQK